MKKWATAALAMSWLTAFAPPATGADGQDHLKCAQITGAKKTKVEMRIDALEERFDSARCKVGRAKMFCSPTARVGIEPSPQFEFVEGDEAAGDYVCYKAKCRKRPDAEIATDAFGTRGIRDLKAKLLCVPAQPGA